MRPHKPDRRSQRTRRLVRGALTERLFEKRYAAITVQDLLDRAGIGRSTFYAHYFDKEDALAALAEQVLESVHSPIAPRGAGQTIVPSLELFRHVHKYYRPSFQAMLRGGTGERVWASGQVLLSRHIEQALATTWAENGPPAVPLAVVEQYLAGAFLQLLKWWLAAELPYTPEQMDQIFQQLALPGVWTTIAGNRDEGQVADVQ